MNPETEYLYRLVGDWDRAVTECTADPDDPDASKRLAAVRDQIVQEVMGVHPPWEIEITQAHETLDRAQEILSRAWDQHLNKTTEQNY